MDLLLYSNVLGWFGQRVSPHSAIRGIVPRPGPWLQKRPIGSDNRWVNGSSESMADPTDSFTARAPFRPGAIVIVTLGSPREKFWGMVLMLASEGLSLSGIELAAFEDFVVMVKDGEPFTPAVVFFPMHRIERIELDLPDGSLPSLSQRFFTKTGLQPSALLAPSEPPDQNRHELRMASRADEEPA
jgi:hypothetical protein